jgi:histone H2A
MLGSTLPCAMVRKQTKSKSNPKRSESKQDGRRHAKKAAAGRKLGGPKKMPVSRSVKAGLQFPVGRIERYAARVGSGAPVYLAAEVLKLASNAARDNKRNRIIPRHFLLAVRNDEELGRLLAGVNIAHGGMLPNIHSVLTPV